MRPPAPLPLLACLLALAGCQAQAVGTDDARSAACPPDAWATRSITPLVKMLCSRKSA